MAVENLNSYTEVDSPGVLAIDVSGNPVTANPMQRGHAVYLYKDFGVEYFHDFDVEFDFLSNGIVSSGEAIVMGLSNTIGTYQDFATANDGITVRLYGVGTNIIVELRGHSTDNVDTAVISPLSPTFAQKYAVLSRQ